MRQNNYKTELLYLFMFFGVFALMQYSPEKQSNSGFSDSSAAEISSDEQSDTVSNTLYDTASTPIVNHQIGE